MVHLMHSLGWGVEVLIELRKDHLKANQSLFNRRPIWPIYRQQLGVFFHNPSTGLGFIVALINRPGTLSLEPKRIMALVNQRKKDPSRIPMRMHHQVNSEIWQTLPLVRDLRLEEASKTAVEHKWSWRSGLGVLMFKWASVVRQLHHLALSFILCLWIGQKLQHPLVQLGRNKRRVSMET